MLFFVPFRICNLIWNLFVDDLAIENITNRYCRRVDGIRFRNQTCSRECYFGKTSRDCFPIPSRNVQVKKRKKKWS